jgi:hypothetical protein
VAEFQIYRADSILWIKSSVCSKYNVMIYRINLRKILMFSCPKCGAKLPKWKSLYMNNFIKVCCRNCESKLKPDKKMLSKIGGIGGAIIGGIGALLFAGAIRSGNWPIGLLLILILTILVQLISSIFVVSLIKFTVINEDTES